MTAETGKKPINVVSDAQLEELQALSSDCDRLQLTIRGRVLQVVVTPPSRTAYQRFLKTAQDVKKRQYAAENLVTDCVIQPNPESLAMLIEQYPAIVDSIAAWIIEAGGGVEVETK